MTIEIDKGVLKVYHRIYHEYTKPELLKLLKSIKKKTGRLDSITVSYYIRPKRFGGLDYGKMQARRVR